MIVCHCAGVTDQAILQLAREGAQTVKDIVRASGAGRCCAPCRSEIATLLSQHESLAAAAE
ncbi:(2Fe-2S)-binding protein [bacterium]|nr:(2Fe-2S)-binding protein [bacterium]